MTLALSGAGVGHLAVAAGLTYALGFERNLRGAGLMLACRNPQGANGNQDLNLKWGPGSIVGA